MEFADLIKTPKIDKVVLNYPGRPSQPDGTLCITGHHLILSWRKQTHQELWLLHSGIDAVDKKVTNMNGGSITVKYKDLKTLTLELNGVEECNNVTHSLECLSNLVDVSYSYPFFHRATFDVLEDGWMAFAVETEFAKLATRTDEWRITYVNKDFSVCPTYPRAVVVPKNVDDETLLAVSSFRHNGRFPVLSYYHGDSGVRLINHASVMRCGQPMIGPNGRRCKEDERLVNATLPPGKRGYIVDTRPQNLAQMAKAKGGGFEPEVHYPQWRRVHKAIDRPHVLMDSLCKLVEACSDVGVGVDKWLSRLESSNWLSHVKDVLNCACLVAQCIDREGASVLIHGTEGTDTTLQVASLAQVILDPDCRTVRGFEALVEREWLQAGHPFALRCQRSAFANPNSRTKNHSPIFLLFLDSVWQVYQQFPCSFEFNEHFLVMLFEHSYSSQYGTFLGNCERDRKELNLSAKTVSLWSFINRPEVLQSYLNPLYEPNASVVWPSVAPMSLNLWSGLFLRWVMDQSSQGRAWKTMMEIKERDKEVRTRVTRLRRQLVELEREALETGLIQPIVAP